MPQQYYSKQTNTQVNATLQSASECQQTWQQHDADIKQLDMLVCNISNKDCGSVLQSERDSVQIRQQRHDLAVQSCIQGSE